MRKALYEIYKGKYVGIKRNYGFIVGISSLLLWDKYIRTNDRNWKY